MSAFQLFSFRNLWFRFGIVCGVERIFGSWSRIALSHTGLHFLRSTDLGALDMPVFTLVEACMGRGDGAEFCSLEIDLRFHLSFVRVHEMFIRSIAMRLPS